MSRSLTTRPRLVLTVLFALPVLWVLVRDLELVPYDDAYFFKRFALNFLRHGSFSWNVADGPVHGLTSQLLGFISIGLCWAAPTHFVLALKALSAGCLLGSAWLLAPSFARRAGKAAGFALLLLTFGSPLVTGAVHTGMETALTLLVLCACLSEIVEHAESPRRVAALRAAALTTLVYLCRPDAALIPVTTFMLLHARRPRRVAELALALGCMLGACLLAFKLYYGTALPLPFYAKTLGLGPYDSALRQLAAPEKRLHFLTWLAFAAPLPVLALGRRRVESAAFALSVAGAVFALYHLLLTTEIMGYRSRFYVPALVPWGLAASQGLDAVDRAPARRKLSWLVAWACLLGAGYHSGVLASRSGGALERVLLPAYLAQLGLTAWLCFRRSVAAALPGWPLPALGGLALVQSVAGRPPRLASFHTDAELLGRSSAEVTTTRGLSDLARCISVQSLYHSEIGVPGLLLPDARVVDLAGLMSEELALEGPAFDDYCLRDRPEAIFMPHPTYAAQNREILGSRCLRDYVRVVSRSASPLYVRRDLAPRFRSCATDVARFR